jgi:phosphohistidine phosphatase
MLENDFIPEIIVSSPAERARQTATLVRASARLDGPIRFDERIYGAGTSDILDIISELDDTAGSAMLVGHNPTFENAVQVLTGKYERMPTATLAVIDLEITEWKGITPGCGRLREFLRPKEIS